MNRRGILRMLGLAPIAAPAVVAALPSAVTATAHNGALTAAQLVTKPIAAAQISAGAIRAEQIAAGTISADKLSLAGRLIPLGMTAVDRLPALATDA